MVLGGLIIIGMIAYWGQDIGPLPEVLKKPSAMPGVKLELATCKTSTFTAVVSFWDPQIPEANVILQQGQHLPCMRLT